MNEKMGDYRKIANRDEIIQGFVPANPIEINPKGRVKKELKEIQFNGRKDEDPLEHLQLFHEACESQPLQVGVTRDQINLMFFKYSLGQKTKDWVSCLPSKTINT
ncbi:putative athila retroelement ORF1 protein [Trifolium medium]|uniref:Putative athila retroelement ORF1 protein n=1 Tax=Trifolium medium TaxID=97028 RepID=A0A392PMD2_9FABA|nr:putative athila retroelement ORF1 protein [Trifolium medium]